MEHVWVGRPSLRVPHGPHQLPALHVPGLHSPPSKSLSPPHRRRCSFILDSVTVWFCFTPLTFTLSCLIFASVLFISSDVVCAAVVYWVDMHCQRDIGFQRPAVMLHCSGLVWTSGPLLQRGTSSLLCDWCQPVRAFFFFCLPVFLFPPFVFPHLLPVSEQAVTSPSCLCGSFHF